MGTTRRSFWPVTEGTTNIADFVANQLIKAMIKRRIQINGARALLMGLTFIENCPDLRNTRVVDIVAELKYYN